MDYLQRAVDLSKKSYDMGEFPAGAVLVTQHNVYESDLSLGWSHGECTAIDKALAAEGGPLVGATLYTSMESCLMCYAKMYWSGVKSVTYVIPKAKTSAIYAYEDDVPMTEHLKKFHTPIRIEHEPRLLDEALNFYKAWESKFSTVE